MTRFLLIAALALAACGGDDTGEPTTTRPSAIVVAHQFGTTEIAAAPERVVTVGLSDHETALALGVVPVGVQDWFGERPYGTWPWAADLWGESSPGIVGDYDEVNFEAVAALDPDVIVAAYSGISAEQYATLSEIAPVVAQPADYPPYGAPWQELTLQVGRALGREADAQALVDDVEARFAAARDAHPEWAGRTAAVADPFEAGQWAVFAPSDPKSVFLSNLGFTIPDSIAAAAGSENAAVVSSERIDLLDVDHLVLMSSEGLEQRLQSDALFQRLDVVASNDVLYLSYEDPPLGAALSFNTVLSIPWAIDEIVAMLEGD